MPLLSIGFNHLQGVKMKKIISLLISLLFVGSVNAALMNFDYTYTDGSVLSGSFDGTIQTDSDTVFINSFNIVQYDLFEFSSIELSDFASVSDFPSGDLQPLVSFSGDAMDIFVCPNGFIAGNCGFSFDSGFFLGTATVGVGAGLGDDTFENFNANNWNLTTASVPAPSSILIFSMAVIGFAFSRGKKQV